RLGEPEGADHEAAEPRQPDLGAAPRLAERVEAILQELGRGEDAAGGKALDDLVVEELVDVAVRLRGVVRLGEVAEGEARGGALFTFFLVIDRIYHLTELVITKGVPFHLVL